MAAISATFDADDHGPLADAVGEKARIAGEDQKRGGEHDHRLRLAVVGVAGGKLDRRRRGQQQHQLLEQIVVERAEELRGRHAPEARVAAKRRQVFETNGTALPSGSGMRISIDFSGFFRSQIRCADGRIIGVPPKRHKAKSGTGVQDRVRTHFLAFTEGTLPLAAPDSLANGIGRLPVAKPIARPHGAWDACVLREGDTPVEPHSPGSR